MSDYAKGRLAVIKDIQTGTVLAVQLERQINFKFKLFQDVGLSHFKYSE